MHKTAKKWIIAVLVVIVVAVAGYTVFQLYIRPKIVDYAFGKVVTTVMGALKETEPPTPSPEPTPVPAEPTPSATPEPTPEPPAPKKKSVDNMSMGQIASVISSNSALMSQLESIVSQGDKERVLSLLMSNFSNEEISQYAGEVAAGMSSARRSELASIARSRLTSSQWSECLGMLSKYVDQLRPLIEQTVN